MVFSSLSFLGGFLPIFLAAYFCAPRKFRNSVLFFGSLVFYAWGEPVYILIMLFSTVLDYSVGLGLERSSSPSARRALLRVSVVVNLGLLGFFKYSGFVLGIFGLSMTGLPLPIGISFYTFQTMSYSIDVYRGDTPVQKDIISFGAYVTMFPQLIAGPIVRYADVQRELSFRRETFEGFSAGVSRFVAGLSKKVLLANNFGSLWDTVKVMDSPSALTAWLGITAFSLQLYFDFSGYSDMAIGLGKMLGFEFPENFNYPYISQSIAEFWRRWHMTLGEWFKLYLYIPLGGNRGSVFKVVSNLMVVWLITGLWHGAAWNFVLWGGYFGILLCCEKYLWGERLKSAPKVFRHFYTLILITVSWVLFEAAGFNFLLAMVGANAAFDATGLYLLSSYGFMLLVGAAGATPLPLSLTKKIADGSSPFVPLCSATMLALSLSGVIASGYNPFLYFRF